jgi:DNA-binding phage protein
MTKDKLIERLYKDRHVNEMLRRINRYYVEDFKQELFLILMDMSEERLLTLHHNQLLYPFINKIIGNQTHSNTSPFYKKYRSQHKIIQEVAELPQVAEEKENDYDLEYCLKRTLEEVNKIEDWYERQLTKYVLIAGMKVTDIAKKTGIKRKEIYKVVSIHRKNIHAQLKREGLHLDKLKGYKKND